MAKLIFEYSSMNAGKSTNLLQTAYTYEENNINVLLLKPSLDDRTSNTISSRIGIEKECSLIGKKESIVELYYDYIISNKIEVLLIDEAQFLTEKQVYELRNLSISLNITVLCYGLRTTFEGKPFDGSAILLALADILVENRTICVICGKKATMNLKIDKDGNVIKKDSKIIDTGKENKYKSVCFRHWFEAINN